MGHVSRMSGEQCVKKLARASSTAISLVGHSRFSTRPLMSLPFGPGAVLETAFHTKWSLPRTRYFLTSTKLSSCARDCQIKSYHG